MMPLEKLPGIDTDTSGVLAFWFLGSALLIFAQITILSIPHVPLFSCVTAIIAMVRTSEMAAYTHAISVRLVR